MNLNAIIIIPEITKGMKSIGSKSLLKIKNVSVLEYQIKQIKAINRNIHIGICTGFDSDKIEEVIKKSRYSINMCFNIDYVTTNQFSSVIQYINKFNIDNLLIISSGVLFKKSTINTSTLKNNSKIYILDKPKSNFTIGCSPGDTVEYLFYDLIEPWSECVFLNSEAIKVLIKINKEHPMCQMYLFEAINTILSHGIYMEKVYVSKKGIMKINHPKDIIKAKVFV